MTRKYIYLAGHRGVYYDRGGLIMIGVGGLITRVWVCHRWRYVTHYGQRAVERVFVRAYKLGEQW